MPARSATGHRILAVTKSMQRGGAEVLLIEQVRALRKLGHQVDVLHDSKYPGPIADELRTLNCQVVGIKAPHRRPLTLRSHAGGYCIIHTHSPLPASTVRVAVSTAWHRPGIVHTEHNVWPAYHPATRFVNRCSFPLVDRAVAVSHVVERSMSEAARRRTVVVHHGVDVETVSRRGRAGAGSLRHLLGLPSSTPIIGTIANLRPEKDYPNLLRAAAHVLQRRPETVFVSIGHGPLMDTIRGLAEDLGVAGNVHLLGRRDDALELISDVDVFALASRYEGLPVALMEAMALSLPIVATDAGGVPELVRHGETGLCVPRGAPEQLAGAIITLLDDRGEARRLAACARDTIEQNSPSAAASQIVDIYDSVCLLHA